jgi:beta-lactamase regulating signal transducer with metallopeptidase domain
MIKKLFSAMLAITLLFTPISGFLVGDHVTTVSAKGYKSGKKSFNSNTNSPSLIKKDDTQQKSSTTTKSNTTTKPKAGSLMKGLFLGGLAGLLLGGLLSNLGILGSLIGLAINILAIFAVIFIIRKVIAYFINKNKRKHKEDTIWGK